MPFSSRKKKHSLSNSAPTIGLASHPQPVYPWSAHTPRLGPSPSPFPRSSYALSTTATAAGELFLFGGCTHDSVYNDLYVLSTLDFSTTVLQTSGETPNPRYGHGAVLTSTLLLVWGGDTTFSGKNAQDQGLDDSLYLLNLVSREWARVVVNGPGPCGRYNHTMTLVGSKLFVFGGRINNKCFNDIWAFDLSRLNSNPVWESYGPAPGARKPPRRCAHVSVTTGDRIIVFGGGYGLYYNDTWSFDISTRKWTELQCTGSIPSPRAGHATVLVDGAIYVFGGNAIDKTGLGDLTALNLSTQRWTTFQDIGPSPSGRGYHAMASDGTRVFVLGGSSPPGVPVDETKPIHVLNTKQLDYSKVNPNDVNPSEKTTQLARKSSAGPLTQGQQQSTSSLDAHVTHGPNDLPSQPPGVDDKSRRVPEEDDNSEGSTERHAKLVTRGASSEKQVARLEHERLTELVRQLSATLAAQTEQNRRVSQEQREMQVKLDELLLSRDHVLQKASRATEANERSQQALAEVRAELEARKSELAAVHLRLTDVENGWAKSKVEADTLRAQIAAGLINTDEDGVTRRLMERVRALEAKMGSPRVSNEKSIEMMECTNED